MTAHKDFSPASASAADLLYNHSYSLNIIICQSLVVDYFCFISLLMFNQTFQRTVYSLLLCSSTVSSTMQLQSWSYGEQLNNLLLQTVWPASSSTERLQQGTEYTAELLFMIQTHSPVPCTKSILVPSACQSNLLISTKIKSMHLQQHQEHLFPITYL